MTGAAFCSFDARLVAVAVGSEGASAVSIVELSS
jgi:hypothetical protein